MDRLLRHAAPLVLLGLAVLVWFEPWIPGHAWIAETVGPDAVLRFVTGCVCVYAAILIVERRQMGTLFKQVLEQFKRFHQSQGLMRSGDDPAARAEAVGILISALRSDDPGVRKGARTNLARLFERDLGDDPQVWQAAAEREFPRT